MAKIVGGRINLGVARETTRGACVNPTYWMPWVTLGFDDKVTSVNSAEALGVIDDSHEKFVVEKWGEGDIEGEIRDESFGFILYALLGSVNSAAAVASTYDHTFSLANTNQHTTLTLTMEDPNQDRQWCQAMLNTLEISAALGEYVKFTAGFLSKVSHETSADSSAGSFGVEHKFRAQDVQIKLAANRAGLAAASVIRLQSFTISFAKNVLKKMGLGTIDPVDFVNQAFSAEGQFQLPFEDTTYRNLMLDNTYNAMEVKIINEDVELADGAAYHPTVTITLPRVGFMDWTPDRPKGELAEQTIGFKAYRDHANSEDSVYSIVLRNDVASY